MDISNVWMGAAGNALLSTEKTAPAEEHALFQSVMEELRFRADLLNHLKGVPSDAVYIAPNMLEKMRENPSAYDFYMEQLDYFVGEYKRCNMPGVMEMSFFIRADGQYGIRAENILLKRQCEAAGGVDPTDENEEEELWNLLNGQSPLQLSDTSMLSFYLAGAYAMAGERLRLSHSERESV